VVAICMLMVQGSASEMVVVQYAPACNLGNALLSMGSPNQIWPDAMASTPLTRTPDTPESAAGGGRLLPHCPLQFHRLLQVCGPY
jgi:hypothetical protein